MACVSALLLFWPCILLFLLILSALSSGRTVSCTPLLFRVYPKPQGNRSTGTVNINGWIVASLVLLQYSFSRACRVEQNTTPRSRCEGRLVSGLHQWARYHQWAAAATNSLQPSGWVHSLVCATKRLDGSESSLWFVPQAANDWLWIKPAAHPSYFFSRLDPEAQPSLVISRHYWLNEPRAYRASFLRALSGISSIFRLHTAVYFLYWAQ